MAYRFFVVMQLAAWAIITGVLELVAPLSFPMSFGRALLMVLAGLVPLVIYSIEGPITNGGSQFSRRRTGGTRRGT